MPLGGVLGLVEWDEGNRNLRRITHNGLHLPELRLNHRLTMTTSLAADGTETRRSAGRLRFGFDLFCSQQERVVDHEAAPLAPATQASMTSQWKLGCGGSAMPVVNHRPRVLHSAAPIGYTQLSVGFNLPSHSIATHEARLD